MNWVQRFLDWLKAQPRSLFAIGVATQGAVLIYAIGTLNTFLSFEDSSPIEPNSISGSERLYPVVREGDDKFSLGQHDRAWDKYEYTIDALKQLQAEYPKRAQKYRDAERVVQSRMHLAQAAGYLEHILPNKANSADAKIRGAD